MTFAAPLFLLAALAAALAVTALHFLARQRPPAAPLPTARFVPDRPMRAPSRALRPADVVLLALRVAAVVLAGLALAQPRRSADTRAMVRIVALERSRAVADPAGAVDSARAWLRDGDLLLAFDSAARELRAESLRSAPPRWEARGRHTAALLGALRAAASLKGRAAAIELVVVSPFVAENRDAATTLLRAQWRAGIRAVRVAARPERPAAIEVAGGASDDPLAAAVALLGRAGSPAAVRLRRDAAALTARDSAFAAAGGVVVNWPAGAAQGGDTSGAVVARGIASGGEAVVVAGFARAAPEPRRGAVVARWADGAPAASEWTLGNGCVRDVAIAVDPMADLALGPAMGRVVSALAAPCGGPRDFTPLPDSAVSGFAGAAAPLAASLAPDPRVAFPPSTRWLLAAAALALLGEMTLRRRAT